MRVFGYATDDKSRWTAPFPEGPDCVELKLVQGTILVGWKARLLGGDMMSPWGWQLRPEATANTAPNFFNAIPERTRRLFLSFPCLPFFSVRIGRFGFYIGWKVFGVDSPAYKDYPGVNPSEVYDGSQAFSGLTMRFTNKR